MYNASVSSINKKVLTVRPKWHYYVPYLINFSNRLKRNNCSFKCYHIVASLKELVVPLHMDQFGSFKGFLFMKESTSQLYNKWWEKLIICLPLIYLTKLHIFVISVEVHEMEKLWFNYNRSLNRGLYWIISDKCVIKRKWENAKDRFPKCVPFSITDVLGPFGIWINSINVCKLCLIWRVPVQELDDFNDLVNILHCISEVL